MNSNSMIRAVLVSASVLFAVNASAAQEASAVSKPEEAAAKHEHMKMKPHNHQQEKMGINAPGMMPTDKAAPAKDKAGPEKKEEKKDEKHDHTHDNGKS